MRVAVGVDTAGRIRGLVIIDHKETTPFFSKIKAGGYPGAFVGKDYDDSFAINGDVDAVSGATVSLTALLTSVRRGVRRVASDVLEFPVEPEETVSFEFGFHEALLVLLFLSGFAVCSKSLSGRPRLRVLFRWGTRLTGLAFLGFVLAAPLSIVNIHSLLAGYWPDWHSHVYWYLLIVGVLISLLLTSKDVYCQTFCPFGAAQDVVKAIGGGRHSLPKKYHIGLRWLQRGLAWAAVVLALLFRDPGRFNNEGLG